MRLEGRTVLLTGASGGLGQAIALRLHAAGAKLVLTGRRADALAELADRTDARTLTVDLAEPAEVERLAGECADAEVLVTNAGLPGSGHLLSFSVEELDRALAVNLRAPMVLSRLLGARMVDRGAGHIVLVSSLSGKAATAGSSVYSATKFGLRGFGLALREDLRPAGVGVSVLLPGFVGQAGMFADSGARLPGFVGLVSPHDVAEAVADAVERNRGEVEVAPLALRAGSTFASVAPGLAAALGRRLGSTRIAEDMGAGQRDKR
ncbi:MAG TPA: SDR family NAD(P)-dependent oxidoreductase [Solirubrobacteraceae bacterium]|nr:SDR family NAD(P)-dependent oxidoreductase [Solirubrobacteraceae bacterium]